MSDPLFPCVFTCTATVDYGDNSFRSFRAQSTVQFAVGCSEFLLKFIVPGYVFQIRIFIQVCAKNDVTRIFSLSVLLLHQGGVRPLQTSVLVFLLSTSIRCYWLQGAVFCRDVESGMERGNHSLWTCQLYGI